MRIDLQLIYSQFDARWAQVLLGFNTQQPYNIYNYGCLITSQCTILKYFGIDITPDQLNQKYKDNKAFAPGGGNYAWGSLPKLFTNITENLVNTPDLLTDAQIAEIKAAIDQKLLVMIQLDYNPQTVANETHYVVITGYNPTDENDFTIADPLGGKSHSLKDYLGWFKPNARKTISQYIIYKGPIPKVDSGTVAVSKTDFPNIIHGSTEWDKTVNEYKPGNDPKVTQFEDIQKVISGYKAETSASNNKVTELQKNLAAANTEIDNQKDKVANTEAKCQRDLDAQKALYNSLKDSTPNVEKLRTYYEGKIKEIEGSLRAAQKQNGQLQLELTQLQSGQAKDSIFTSFLKRIGVLK